MSQHFISDDGTPSQSRLLTLPPELRNIIYLHAFKATHTIVDISDRRTTHEPSLLLTCKQVHAEAIQLFYANTTFRFPAVQDIRMRIMKWLSTLEPNFSSLVQHVALYTDLQSWTTGRMGARKPISSPFVKVRRIHRLRARVCAVLPHAVSILVNTWSPSQRLVDKISESDVMEACRGCWREMDCVWTTEPMAENKRRIAMIRAELAAEQNSRVHAER